MAKKSDDKSTPQDDKAKRLQMINDKLMPEIKKRFGEDIIFHGQNTLDVESVSTGSIAVDRAIGIGGLPKGRITEIYGPESSGKTTFTLHLIAEAQRAGDICAFVDVENALDTSWARRIGVDTDELFISQPNSGEEALALAETLVESGMFGVVVIDSVSALVPRAEIDGEMGDSHVGLQARLMSQALRKLTGKVKQNNAIVVFINQLREKIGVVYGNPEVTSGGRALKFYSSVRLDIRRIQSIKASGESVGNRTRIRVTKNKVSAPFREAEFDIMFDEGISTCGEILDFGVELGIITKRGAYYSYNDENIGQGKEKAKDRLRDPEYSDTTFEIHQKILAALEMPPLKTMPIYDKLALVALGEASGDPKNLPEGELEIEDVEE